MGRLVLTAWSYTLLLSYAALGGYLGKVAEGYDLQGVSPLPWMATGVAVLISVALTFRWALRAKSPASASEESEEAGPRRRFLLGVAAAGGGTLATGAIAVARNFGWYQTTGKHIFLVKPPYAAERAKPEWAGAQVASYRRLGRTDVRVSDISIGSGAGTGGRQTADVVREAIERGINYFDTAPDYAATDSEMRFGEAMAGVRDEVFLATKFCTPQGHLGPGTSVEAYMEAVNGSLRRLRTDRVDLVHIHSCDSVDRLLDENVHEAFDRLKDQGKARFLGVSTHTPDLETVASAAIESDRFDVLMLAYHHGAWPNIGEIIDRASARDIGVVAMKTLRGAKHRGIPFTGTERDSYTQAAFKWVLSNPSVSCLVISLWERAQLDEFLYASGKVPTREDLAILERYRALTRGSHCLPHCGACLDHCPEGVPIHDVLRQRMYFEDYGAEKEAMRGYAALEVRADACASCAAPCAGSCPHDIDIPERTREAHRLLTPA